MWGFEDHLELGDAVFVAQPAGHIKRWGRVGERERAMRGQRGVSRKLRAPGLQTAKGGRAALLSGLDPAFRCTQVELLA